MTFEEYKNTHFSGNTELALRTLAEETYTKKYIYVTCKEDITAITGSLPEKYRETFMDYFYEEAKKNPAALNKAIDTTISLSFMRLTPDEILSATVNPFKIKILRDLLIILGIVVLAVVGYILSVMNVTDIVKNISLYILGLGCILSGELGINIVNYFKFNKAKKYLLKLEEENDETTT